MDILIKNIKKIVKLGTRGVGVFLTKEISAAGLEVGDSVVVATYKKGKKKGIIIEKVD